MKSKQHQKLNKKSRKLLRNIDSVTESKGFWITIGVLMGVLGCMVIIYLSKYLAILRLYVHGIFL